MSDQRVLSLCFDRPGSLLGTVLSWIYISFTPPSTARVCVVLLTGLGDVQIFLTLPKLSVVIDSSCCRGFKSRR